MDKKPYLFISAGLFAVVAFLHLWRAIAGIPVHVGEGEFPLWLSWAGAVVAACLSIWGIRLSRS